MKVGKIRDFWYTKIRKFHKHTFVRIHDGNMCGVPYQRYQCEECGQVLNLDDWQIADLPRGMKYSKRKKF